MTPWVGRLLFANVALFFATWAFPGLGRMMTLVPRYALVTPWTLVTYMFVHGGLMHLFLNMLVLFFFGPRLEHRLGGRDFLWLYFVSGIVAGIVSVVTPFVIPAFSPYVGVVGASGAIYGLLLAFAMYWPRERIIIFIPIPIPIEVRWMVLFMTLFAFYGIFMEAMGVRQGVAHHAHLGGFFGAWAYMKWREKNSAAARFKAKAEVAPRKGWRHDRDALARWARIDRGALHEVNRDAYDEIMARLDAGGVAALTDRDRAFLDRFSPP
jgi:membrane associated rhomboid family serine protease